MKKMVFIFMLIISITNVKALPTTYYGEYGNFTEPTTSIATESDIMNVKTERRYRYYNEVRVNDGYYIEDMNNQEFPLIDKNDYQLTSFSDWSLNYPSEMPNRIVDARTIYEYSDLKDVRYIHLYGLNGSYGGFRISELQIEVNGVPISYNYDCSSCSTYFGNYINNGLIYENMSIVYNGGYLRLDLKDYYNPADIKIKLYLFDMGNDMKTYGVAFTEKENMDSIFGSQYYMSFFTYRNVNEIAVQEITFNDMQLSQPEYKEVVRSEQPVLATKTRIVNTFQEFRSFDILYHYYKIDKVYSSSYLLEANSEYPYQEVLDYQDYYSYRLRDKLVVEEPIVIDENHQLTSYIIESTGNVIIDGIIDTNINDTYNVNLVLNDLKIPVSVKVELQANIKPVIVDPVIVSPIIEEPVIKPIIKEELVIEEKPISNQVNEVVDKEEVVIEDEITDLPPVLEKEIKIDNPKQSSFEYLFLFISIIPIVYILVKKYIKYKNEL